MKREKSPNGFYKWMRMNSREGNSMGVHNCLRNNWRKAHGLPLFRTVKNRRYILHEDA